MTHEVSMLLSRATQHSLDAQDAEAIALLREVIRHDPLCVPGWKLLASSYENEGKDEAARQMRLCALHLEGDPEDWKDLGTSFR